MLWDPVSAWDSFSWGSDRVMPEEGKKFRPIQLNLERAWGSKPKADRRPAFDQFSRKVQGLGNHLRPLQSAQALWTHDVVGATGASPHQLTSRSGQVRAVSGLTILVGRNDQTLISF